MKDMTLTLAASRAFSIVLASALATLVVAAFLI